MALLALKVSPKEKALCTRRMVSPPLTVPSPFTSENTIQPVCQVGVPLQVGAGAVGFVELQTVTVWPSLIASERAYCMSPRSPFTSLEMRLALVTYWYEGTAIAISTPTIVITTSSSRSVKAVVKCQQVHARNHRDQTFREADDSDPWCSGCDGIRSFLVQSCLSGRKLHPDLRSVTLRTRVD